MAGNYHTLRDAEVLLVMYSDMRFFETGFRFVRIDFLEEKTVYIKSVMATSFSRKLQPKGSFRCSDERVNEIFRVASRTLMLNMHDYLWDGIKRDRLVWVGDMHPETTAIACLFGDDPSIGRSLTYSREHTPLPNWMNRTPTYTAWWLIILHDYYMQNGRLSFLKEQRAYVDGALRQLNGVVREDGTIARDGSYLFDWPSHGSDDETAGIYALWVLAAKKSRSLFKTLGLDVRVCDDMLGKLSRYRRLSVRIMKQCEAFLVYAGVKGAENACSFLTRGGAKKFSTFMSYYILHSIAAAGRGRARWPAGSLSSSWAAVSRAPCPRIWSPATILLNSGTSTCGCRPTTSTLTSTSRCGARPWNSSALSSTHRQSRSCGAVWAF